MEKHLYVIGTERKLIPEFIDTYFDEVDYIHKTTGEDITFVLIDEGLREVSEYNKEVIKHCKKTEVKSIHFDMNMQQKLFMYLKKNLTDPTIVELLDYKGYSYGRVMNKQFLMASILGTEYLHRRDSDIKILKDVYGFPSYYENKYLGKKVNEVNELYGIKSYMPEQTIYMVGSGYSGNSNWKADFNVFMESDNDLIENVANLFNYGNELKKEYLNEIMTGNISVKEEVLVLPKENYPNPICGNLSMYHIYKYLPCSTISSTIGSDNLIRNFLKEFGFPIVYHSNFVYHKFGLERNSYNISYLLSYWPKMINKLIYYKIVDDLIFKFIKSTNNRFIILEEIDFEKILDIDRLTYEYVYTISRECIYLFVEIMRKGKNKLFITMTEEFSSKSFLKSIVDNMYYGLIDGYKLTRNWKEIINLCENYSLNVNI